MAKITSWPAELLKSAPLSKAAYHVPILVGAVPFDLRISLGFSFIPAFTSKNSVLRVASSSSTAAAAASCFRMARPGLLDLSMSRETSPEQDNRVVAAGPVGFTAATEAPRLELTMGWPPSAIAGSGLSQLHRFLWHCDQRDGQSNSMPDQHHGLQRERRICLLVTKHLRRPGLERPPGILRLSRSGRRPQSLRVLGVLCVPAE